MGGAAAFCLVFWNQNEHGHELALFSSEVFCVGSAHSRVLQSSPGQGLCVGFAPVREVLLTGSALQMRGRSVEKLAVFNPRA